MAYNKKLSSRLLAMAGFVRKGERVLDVGSDHAMLPLYLVENGVSPAAILTDRVPGPLRKSYERVSRVLGHEAAGGDEAKSVTAVKPVFPCALGPYEFRIGDGLTAVRGSGGEATDGNETSGVCADVAVIAGMGGETIAGILAREPLLAAGFRRLILQPRTKSDELRACLTRAGFEIIVDTAAEEKGRMCEILVAMANDGNR